MFMASYTSSDAGSSGGATLLDSGISAVIGKAQSVLISSQLKVIPLVCYSVILYCILWTLQVTLQVACLGLLAIGVDIPNQWFAILVHEQTSHLANHKLSMSTPYC